MRRVLAALALPLALATLALAEDLDVGGRFDRAKSEFQEKRYGRSLADLKVLAEEIGRLRIAQVLGTMPTAPEGWTLEPGSELDASAVLAMFAGGVIVQRDYAKGGEARVMVQVIADSRMVGGVVTWFSHPELLPPTMKIVTHKGRRALLDVEPDARRTALKVVLADDAGVVAVDATGVPREEFDAFADRLDLDRVEKAVGE